MNFLEVTIDTLEYSHEKIMNILPFQLRKLIGKVITNTYVNFRVIL